MEITVADTAKEVKIVLPARKIVTRKLEFTVADFEDFERAIKNKTEVFLINSKKHTSVRGVLIEWVDRDEGKESAIFRSSFRKNFRKIKLGQIYLAEKVKP